MSATPPAGETAPPRRVSLVLHPRRDISEAVACVRQWAGAAGVNLGRLGYLTEVDGEQLPEALAAVASGAFAIEERFAINAAWREDGHLREQVAYNDVVLSRVPGHGQAALGLSVDGQLLVRYASDGVIAATPAGSAGYTFAAGARLAARCRPGEPAAARPPPRWPTTPSAATSADRGRVASPQCPAPAAF